LEAYLFVISFHCSTKVQFFVVETKVFKVKLWELFGGKNARRVSFSKGID
jgi:hypothetical protein